MKRLSEYLHERSEEELRLKVAYIKYLKKLKKEKRLDNKIDYAAYLTSISPHLSQEEMSKIIRKFY